MLKGLVLPVDIRDEVLGALGEDENGLEVDDFRAGGLDRGVLLGQHAQIVQVILFAAVGIGILVHVITS